MKSILELSESFLAHAMGKDVPEKWRLITYDQQGTQVWECVLHPTTASLSVSITTESFTTLENPLLQIDTE